MFEKERMDVCTFNDFNTFAQLSFPSLPQISTSFSQPYFSKTPILLACEPSSKESCHCILLPITCYYAQYRIRSAILRNHLKLSTVFLFLKWRMVLSTVEIINHRDKLMFFRSYLYRAGPLLSFRFCGCMHCACTR